jgi:TPR repeat protein
VLATLTFVPSPVTADRFRSCRGYRAIVAMVAVALLSAHASGGEPVTLSPPSGNILTAVEAYNHGNIPLAFSLLKAEADRGDSDAEVNLGYLYARGQGVAPNQLEALRLYRLSAQQGNGEGMNAIGYKYEFGTGIAPDIDKAVHWYCMAVLQGNPRAMNNLALLLDEGKAVLQNISEARNLWRQSAALGHINSMYLLGYSLLYARGQPLDPHEGMRWLTIAAQSGQATAQNLVRRMGFQGALPPPVDQAALMILQPRDAPPGHAEICGSVVS